MLGLQRGEPPYLAALALERVLAPCSVSKFPND
jgi:hypothetical protein